MRVLVLGSGGREHALVWAVGRSPEVSEVLCAPGSDGIAQHARILPADLADGPSIAALAKKESVDLVVVGPEDPLAAGITDVLEARGIAVFGPNAAAAQLEASKEFAKDFMARHGIPTAEHRSFTDPDEAERYVRRSKTPLVIKANGLAAGKGVFVCDGPEGACAAIHEIMRDRRFGAAGASVVIEERLVGEEASFYTISDGERFVYLGAAQDFKRALDGDLGENTGGMGAYSPTPVITPELEQRIISEIVRPVIEGMRAEGRPYRGVLYTGLMICNGDPKVIEFNVRFGDPETEPLMFRLESDLVPLLDAAARGRLPEDAEAGLRFGPPAVCVMMASEGYPRSYPSDLPITGIDELADDPDVVVFHAGTRRKSGVWHTAGGRVLGVTARGATLRDARRRVYDACARIEWKGAQHRSDIAARAAGDA